MGTLGRTQDLGVHVGVLKIDVEAIILRDKELIQTNSECMVIDGSVVVKTRSAINGFPSTGDADDYASSSEDFSHVRFSTWRITHLGWCRSPSWLPHV